MRAKDYIASYKSRFDQCVTISEVTKTGGDMIQALCDEALQLGIRRNGGKPNPSDKIMISVVKELDQKYRAIAREIPILDANGFKKVFAERGIYI